MADLSSRTASFTDSVIRRMTRISLQYDAVNLSQGFPDWDPPKEMEERLSQVAFTGPHQYAVTWGAPNFRQALAAKQKHFTGNGNRHHLRQHGSHDGGGDDGDGPRG